jgi:hypothetical protein
MLKKYICNNYWNQYLCMIVRISYYNSNSILFSNINYDEFLQVTNNKVIVDYHYIFCKNNNKLEY